MKIRSVFIFDVFAKKSSILNYLPVAFGSFHDNSQRN